MPTPSPSAAVPGALTFDALLLLSFGGPEKPEDVVPFLENVTRGRGIPRERLEQVGEHYFGFGGKSPINDQNRALIAALEGELRGRELDLPVYWGNRNWDPYLADTLQQMKEDGVRHAAVAVTSAYSSYSGCRQYREDLAAATAQVPGAPELTKLRHYFGHPGFLQPNLDAVRAGLEELAAPGSGDAALVRSRAGDAAAQRPYVLFVTHSIPTTMNDASGQVAGVGGGAYVAQHQAVAEWIIGELDGERPPFEVVFCSRSGAPHIPWLEPDVNDRVEELAAQGYDGVVVAPIGFISDHMEVVYDLDTEAQGTAAAAGINFVRVATAGVDPRFVAMWVDLLLEADAGVAPVHALEQEPPTPAICGRGCCANPRAPRPALCGRD